MNINHNPFRERVDALSGEDFRLLDRAMAARACREKVGVGTLDEAAAKYRPHPVCPGCGSGHVWLNGSTAAGHQRYECADCGLHYSAFTGTVLEDCKKDLPTWVSFIELMCWNVPIEGIAEILGISHKTAFEWRHRVFATVDGYQDKLVLRKRVWIDETYINDTDLAHGYGEARKRGLSKQKLCIAVGIDIFKTPVARVCGHGKPSTKRMKEAMLGHLQEGSVVVHDMEKSHTGLVRAAGCTDEACRADVRDPEYLECMAMVNNLCSWIKRYLWRFTGMDPANLQSYLNWYVYLFRVNQASDRWPRLERVVRHLLMADATYRTS